MDEIRLPEQLAGPWNHALFLTFGANIPFFENVLWRQLSSRCRNKIILADGELLLTAYEQYAASGLVRYVNHQYIVEGIFAPRAAHAKLILLVNPDKGRLLVGSGNLSQEGYAAGGELFTEYEYSAKTPATLNAFVAVHKLVESLTQLGYVQGPVLKRLELLFSETPWLYKAANNDLSPVRDNLEHSFLAQLKETLAGEAVEELWIMSPFYDEQCRGLAQLLASVQPLKAFLLVQPGRTSVSLDALQSVIHDTRSQCEIRSVRRGTNTPYIHAKLYLAKTAKRSVCLQGSPNLSQVGMMLAHPYGNIEVANLLFGEPSTFDYILDQLEIDPELVTLDELDLSYDQPDDKRVVPGQEFRLQGGEWREGKLVLRYQGELPSGLNPRLVIANHVLPISCRRLERNRLEIEIDEDIRHQLSRPVPVQLSWDAGSECRLTNPVFVCNEGALDSAIEVGDAPELLDSFGELDLDDHELERLLVELDAALVIDRHSIWHLAGRSIPSVDAADDESVRIHYADISYEMLRQHPRIQQYFQRHGGAGVYARTRLQIILNAITGHFRGLLNVSAVEQAVKQVTDMLADPEGEFEEEVEEMAAVRAKQRTQTPVRRLLINFIQRYLQGIRHPDFQEMASYEVMGQNYVIFSHFLWRLFSHDWIEHDLVSGFVLETWKLFWGSALQGGYWQSMKPAEQEDVLKLVREYHADAHWLASIYYASTITLNPKHNELRFNLRDHLRFLLTEAFFTIDESTVEHAWHLVARLNPYNPPRPGGIIEALARLASFETRAHFLRSIELEFGLQDQSCRIENVRVYRNWLRSKATVDCLMIEDGNVLSTPDQAAQILVRWMYAEPRMDYYRVHTRDTNQRAFYDVQDRAGSYWNLAISDRSIDLKELGIPTFAWDIALEDLAKLAVALDKRLTLPLAIPITAQKP